MTRKNRCDGLSFWGQKPPSVLGRGNWKQKLFWKQISWVSRLWQLFWLVESIRLPVLASCKHPRNLKDILTFSRFYDQCCDRVDCNIRPLNWPGACRKPRCVHKIACDCGKGACGRNKKVARNKDDRTYAGIDYTKFLLQALRLEGTAPLHTMSVSHKLPSKSWTPMQHSIVRSFRKDLDKAKEAYYEWRKGDGRDPWPSCLVSIKL